MNGAWSLAPQGADTAIAWIGGARCAVGPVIFGALLKRHEPGFYGRRRRRQ
jgi:hypothetical protein